MWRVLQELILLISTLLRDKIFQGTVLGIVVTHDFEILLAKISELMLEKGFGKQLNANASNLNQSLYQIGSKGNPFWNDTPSIKIYLQFLKHFVLVREHTGAKSGTRAKQVLWWMEDFPSFYTTVLNISLLEVEQDLSYCDPSFQVMFACCPYH